MGLRGGDFRVLGRYLENHSVKFWFEGARFCADVPVSGTARWHRTSGVVRASIRFGDVQARLTWSLATLARAKMRGMVSPASDIQHPLRLTLPAP